MSENLSVKDMLNGESSKYALAVAVAKLAREITDDIVLHGEIVEEKPVNLAIEDLKNEKYRIVAPEEY